MRPFDPQRQRASVPAAAVLLLFVVLISLAAGAAAAADIDFPPLTGRVVDEAGVLTPAERASLTAALDEHEHRTGQQVVVVTLSSLRGRTIEDYGYQLGRHWGIGEKDRNTGALFIIAPKERKVRIEVGYGLEGVLTDAASRIILESVVLPAFRSGQLSPGIVAGTGAILKTIMSEAAENGRPAVKPKPSETISPFAIFIIVLVVLFVAYALSRQARPVPGGLYGRSRRGRGGGGFLGGLGGGIGGGLGGGWGGGGGGDGGGGFSGGGGSFGGGGASADW